MTGDGCQRSDVRCQMSEGGGQKRDGEKRGLTPQYHPPEADKFAGATGHRAAVSSTGRAHRGHREGQENRRLG